MGVRQGSRVTHKPPDRRGVIPSALSVRLSLWRINGEDRHEATQVWLLLDRSLRHLPTGVQCDEAGCSRRVHESVDMRVRVPRQGLVMLNKNSKEVAEIKKALDHEYEDLADAAHAAAEAYEKVHATRDQWIVVARPLRDGPIVTVGPWTTRTQAEKAEKQFVSAHRDSNEGTFSFVTRMYQTSWMQKLEGK